MFGFSGYLIFLQSFFFLFLGGVETGFMREFFWICSGVDYFHWFALNQFAWISFSPISCQSILVCTSVEHCVDGWCNSGQMWISTKQSVDRPGKACLN